jgi:hypothetical protein
MILDEVVQTPVPRPIPSAQTYGERLLDGSHEATPASRTSKGLSRILPVYRTGNEVLDETRRVIRRTWCLANGFEDPGLQKTKIVAPLSL